MEGPTGASVFVVLRQATDGKCPLDVVGREFNDLPGETWCGLLKCADYSVDAILMSQSS